MNIELKNRILSFIWRLGAMVVVAILGFVSQLLPEITTSEAIVTIVALVVAEITKMLNNKYKLKV